MEIIKIHYKISKLVKDYGEIKKEAEALKEFIDHPHFKGYYNKAYAICHCQVSETPYAFFVVADDVIAEKMLKNKVIINPEIIEAPATIKIRFWNKDKASFEEKDIPNETVYEEACLSFPFRQPKKTTRFTEIKVKYQVSALFGLKTIKEVKTGVIAQIFQHEIGHLNGKNIYFDNETPVKWWELIGTPRSQGGCSIGT